MPKILIYKIFTLVCGSNYEFYVYVKNETIMADATYNFICERYPILTIGTVDRQRVFHPFGLTIASHETKIEFDFHFDSVKQGVESVFGKNYNPNTLIADSAPAITIGFESAFKPKSKKDYNRVNCWAHVIRNIDDELCKVRAIELNGDNEDESSKSASLVSSKTTKNAKKSRKKKESAPFIDLDDSDSCSNVQPSKNAEASLHSIKRNYTKKTYAATNRPLTRSSYSKIPTCSGIFLIFV